MALGWAIQLLADHPDQRQALLDDRALIPTTVEEVIRYEAVSYHSSRVLTEDVELHGTTVPVGSIMVVLPGSANRDDRQFEDPDTFLAARPPAQNLTFGFGPHFCLGASLARLELRIALDVLLDRFSSWDVDHANATLLPGANTRGWERLPIVVT
jgi:cytochrome P450